MSTVPVLAVLLGVIEDLAAAGALGASLLAGLLLVAPADRARAMTPLAVLGGVWTLTQLLVLAPAPRLLPALVAALAALMTLLAVGLGTGARAQTVGRLTGVLAVLGISIRVLGDQGFLLPQAGQAVPVLVHVLAMSVWAGGLGAILLLRARGPLTDPSAVIVRFSHLALLAWCVLALSGLWALLTRLGSPLDLVTTAFGLVGLAKIMLLLVLGVLGALQRRRLAVQRRADGPGRPFVRLAGIELVLMAAAVVLGALLVLLPAPGLLSGAAATGPAADLTGHALPPAPSPVSLLTSWRPDALVIALALTLVWALRFPRTGPRAAPRAPSAELRVVVGAVLLVLVVCGPLGVYGPVLSSAHLLQQGLLLVLVGPLLASAVPTPGGLSRLLHRDPWTAPLLALGPTGLLALVHATPWLLGPALATIPGHELLLLAPVVLGALTWWTVEPGADARRDGDSGADPTLPAGPSARLRVWRTVLAALPVAGLAASGLALALGSTLLASDRFGATGRTWRADALADQQTGGWILVGLAVLAGIALADRAIASRTMRRDAHAHG
ncbi:CopD family protein [Brachybacterium halotolerans subsp. kimchii]|uniref:CopD family protein n=1 Tax=Brachybacterium halotolerans TaxID=2795215 RepID=UPI001E583909|nr:CopD family protein [Brachybacterium halotolerans]UEJ84072.1 CopD family protein [Brachybacterium halotolerans subsp. kimchii]